MNLTGSNGTRKIRITDTTLRDSHQSLLATRLRIEDMLPIVEKMDQVGFDSMEVWGGATFDTCLRFLSEDPWERLIALKKGFKNTPLMMLLRGQNLVGYKHYPDDVVEAFVRAAIRNGISVMRIFDALNDVRNMAKAVEISLEENAHVQATVCYTISPVHDLAHYVSVAKELAKMGAHSLCLKDMAGILSPSAAYSIVKEWKEQVGLPVQVHCHYTSGMASMTYLKAIEAGADVVDCAISAMSMSTSQPPVESLVAALDGTRFDTGLDLEILSDIAAYFSEVRKKYSGVDKASSVPDTNVLRYQVPGGMISNFLSQLTEQGQIHRLREVFEEVPRVRADLGYPPLVTPSSQIVGTQSMLNVFSGQRYKMIPAEVKDYFRGLYGKPPGKVSDEVRKLAIGDEKPIEGRPADYIEPGLAQAKKELGSYYTKEEDVLSYALFPNQAKEFLKERLAARTGVDYNLLEESKKEHPAGFAPV